MGFPVPDWLTMPGITTIQVTAQEFSGGVLVTPTGAQAVDFFTVVEAIDYEGDVELRNVTPSRSRQRNMVIVETGGTFTITELMRRSPSWLGGMHSYNSFAALFHAFDHFKLQFTRSGNGYTHYAVNGGYREGVGREKGTGKAVFAPVGTVEAGLSPAANPRYQAA